jgi:PAS domain S-box-containing protein
MSVFSKKVNVWSFFLNVVLPTLLTVGLFVTLIFGYIIPAFERNMLASKKEMIRELVSTVEGIAAKYHLEEKAGLISIEEAKNKAISRIEHLRYGVDNKDYFWITDMHPVMIMHPYRTDLNGKDLTDFRDPNGKALFVEMVRQIQEKGDGYVDYEWQWMDNSVNIVPKISYVHAFKPWGWIIGTGVYIEDVKNEIAAIKKRLTMVSLGITACMAFLLVLIARNNLKIEIKRHEAERELHISREKYKALVEASTEGTAMLLGNECIFANNKFQELLGIEQADKINPDLRRIISPNRFDDIEKINRFISGPENFLSLETSLTPAKGSPKSVLLSLSKVTLAEKSGMIVVVKELSRDDMLDEEKSQRGEQLRTLADASGVGIFKCAARKNARFIDVNEHMVNILGFSSKENLLKVELADLVDDDSQLKEILSTLSKEQFIKDYTIRLRRQDGRWAVVAITAAAERNQSGEILYLYGTMIDISKQKEHELHKQQLFIEMQGRLLFMDQPITNWVKEIVSCDTDLPITDVAKLMSAHKTNVILVRASNGEFLGTLTDSDIRQRVIASELSTDAPAYKFMSAPLVCVHKGDTLERAVVLMQENNLEHLCVRDNENHIYGIISKSDLINLQHNTGAVLTAAIKSASTISELKSIYQRLPLYVNALTESGARTDVITGVITAASDAISVKLEQFIIQELGLPPVPYAFVALGSEGRCEQTLLTDQDNAIIYQDVEDNQKDEVRRYFQNYGLKMCDYLDVIGFNYCAGDIMAKNPRWNQPLSVWIKYFAKWASQPEPKHLLDSAIFFDFRLICGEQSLILELSNSVKQLLEANPAYFTHLAREGINYRTPLGLFGNIQTISDEGHSKILNIKSPLRVIVNLVRLYSMKHQLTETNSIKRIHRLFELGVFSSSFYKDIVQAYDYMMVLQLKTQANAFSRNKAISNHIDLSNLSTIELNTLKSVLSQLGTFQNKTKNDFGVSE